MIVKRHVWTIVRALAQVLVRAVALADPAVLHAPTAHRLAAAVPRERPAHLAPMTARRLVLILVKALAQNHVPIPVRVLPKVSLQRVSLMGTNMWIWD